MQLARDFVVSGFDKDSGNSWINVKPAMMNWCFYKQVTKRNPNLHVTTKRQIYKTRYVDIKCPDYKITSLIAKLYYLTNTEIYQS